jgi:hypothetical protein
MDRFDLLPPGPGWELTEGEKRLFECAARGDFWKPVIPDGKQYNRDPAKAENWPDECRLRIEVIACLAAGTPWAKGSQPWPLHAKGLRIQGAKIDSDLDFEGLNLLVPIIFWDCAVRGKVNLRDAIAVAISLDGSIARSVDAQRLEVKKYFHLRDGFCSNGIVDLGGARIGEQLSCGGGRFENKDGVALNCDRLIVVGSVLLYESKGRPFCAIGEVCFRGAIIGSQLNLSGAHISNPNGVALRCDAVSISGDVHLKNRFCAQGEVRFTRVDIHGRFDCGGAKFLNAQGTALAICSTNIGSDLLLGGIVELDGILDLGDSHAKTLNDGGAKWPKVQNITLDGFTYERFSGYSTDWKSRLAWIRRQPEKDLKGDFRPQPWSQLIGVFRAMGYDYDARRIGIERAKVIADRPSTKWYTRRWYGFLRWTVGYGYRPELPLYWSLAFFLVGWLTFAEASDFGYMVPRDGSVVIYLEANPAARVPARYPKFNPFVYAMDIYLPVIELGQDEAWIPSAVRAPNAPPIAPNATLARLAAGFFAAGGHRVVYWLEEIAGWIFVSLYIAGMSGIMKKE